MDYAPVRGSVRNMNQLYKERAPWPIWLWLFLLFLAASLALAIYAALGTAEALPWDKTIQLMMLLHGIEGIGSKAPSVITKRKLMIAS